MNWVAIINVLIALLPSLAQQLPQVISDITNIIDEIIAAFQTPPAGVSAADHAAVLASLKAVRVKCVALAAPRP